MLRVAVTVSIYLGVKIIGIIFNFLSENVHFMKKWLVNRP